MRFGRKILLYSAKSGFAALCAPVFAALVLLCAAITASGQVNTEEMRKPGVGDGFSGRAGFEFGLVSGNSDYFTVEPSLRVDFDADPVRLFFDARYKRGVQGGELFVHKGFVHLRGMRKISPVLTLESFLQKEFDDFLRLKDRNLAGGGLRIKLLDSDHENELMRKDETPAPATDLYAGTGLMWENELLEESPSAANLARSTSYISFSTRVPDKTSFSAVVYCQFDISAPSDNRLLLDAAFDFAFTSRLSFRASCRGRYDNRPPTDVKNHDLEITNGLSVSF